MASLVFTEKVIKEGSKATRTLGTVTVERGGLVVHGDRNLHSLVKNVSPPIFVRYLSPRLYAWMVASEFRTPYLQATVHTPEHAERVVEKEELGRWDYRER